METKDGILLEMKAMEKTVEELRNNLNPSQIAKFLLLADKSKTTQEFDIFRLWEIKKNRSRPEMQAMLQQVVQPQAPGVIPSSELHSSKEHGGSSSLEIQNPDEESSQGGFVPNEEDEQNDHYRAMREAASKSSPDEAYNSHDHM